MKIITTSRNSKTQRFLLRGDSEGYVTLWNVPDITIEEVKQIQDRNTIKSMNSYWFFIAWNYSLFFFCLEIHRFNTNDLYEPKWCMEFNETATRWHFGSIEYTKWTIDKINSKHLLATAKSAGGWPTRWYHYYCSSNANRYATAAACQSAQLFRLDWVFFFRSQNKFNIVKFNESFFSINSS